MGKNLLNYMKHVQAYRNTAVKSFASFILNESLSRTVDNVSMSISVKPSAFRASGVYLSMVSKQSAANCGSSNNRA